MLACFLSLLELGSTQVEVTLKQTWIKSYGSSRLHASGGNSYDIVFEDTNDN